MYVDPNYKTKKALKEAIAKGEKVRVFQPNAGITRTRVPANGCVALEGPHYPCPHCWYARGWIENGQLVKVE